MSDYLKNFLYLFVLITLVSMIQCKMDSNKKRENPLENIESKSDSIPADNPKPLSAATLKSRKDSTLYNDTISTSKSEVLEKDNTTTQAKPEKEAEKKKVKKFSPKITFDELEWDFGEIEEGEIIEKKFKFTNTGNAPLEIRETSATCGCTRPSFPFLDIAPGESNVIGVRFNSVGKDGRQDPEVTVVSNTKPSTTVIKLRGTVIPRKTKKKTESSMRNDGQKSFQDTIKNTKE